MNARLICMKDSGVFESWLANIGNFKDFIQTYCVKNKLPSVLYLHVYEENSIHPQVYELSQPIAYKPFLEKNEMCKIYLVNRIKLIKHGKALIPKIKENYKYARTDISTFFDRLIEAEIIDKKIIVPEFKTLNNYFKTKYPIMDENKMNSYIHTYSYADKLFYVIKINNVIYRIQNRGKLTTSLENAKCLMLK